MAFLVHRCDDNREAEWFPAKHDAGVDPDAWLLFREKGQRTLTRIAFCPWCGLALPVPEPVEAMETA